MKVSSRAQVPPFAVMEILAAANARRAAGQSVLNLCAGEPSTGASDVVRELAAQILASGNLGYTESLGVPALRRAIAGHYARWYGLTIDPGQVAVTTGSSGGFMLAFLAAFDVGDRVALARPGYPAYKNILRALGCEVVELDCGPATRYQPTVAQLEALDAPIDGLMVASPANPTGTMICADELARLSAWCSAHGVRLICDEIYHGITYPSSLGAAGGVVSSGAVSSGAVSSGIAAGGGAGAASAAQYLDDGVVIVNSFSKYWAMTGWRLGWLLLPADLVAPVDALAGNVALCPPSLAQHAGVAAFSAAGYAAAQENVARYAACRALLLSRLPELGWSEVAPADGAFYLYANISGSGLDSITWCARLLDEAGVALTPGTDFDAVDGGSWIRLSFASSVEVVGAAVDRIVAWQATLHA